MRRRKVSYISIAVALIMAIYYVAVQQGWVNGTQVAQVATTPGTYKVTRFSDGDTIVVDMNGTPEKVRFIGVDTPETHKPNAPVQCYGPAAAAFTKNIIGQQRVRLVSDQLSTDRDRYKRLLRYVYLEDGRLLNQVLIEQGYGFYYPYFPFSKSTKFDAAQQAARSANKGLWGNCSPTPTDRGGWISNNQ